MGARGGRDLEARATNDGDRGCVGVDQIDAVGEPMASQNVWAAVWRSMRPRQWQANLVAYLPLVFSFGSAWDLGDGAAAGRLLGRASLAFVLLCLTASGGALLNDARDAGADRLHPTRRLRPVAAGLLPIDGAIAAGLGLMFGALTIAAFGSAPLFNALGAYLVVTLLFSVVLRGIAGLDIVATLASCALGVIAGAAAIAVPISGWMLVAAALVTACVVLVGRWQEQMLLRRGAAGAEHLSADPGNAEPNSSGD